MKTSALLYLLALSLLIDPLSVTAASSSDSARRIVVTGHETVRIPATRARLTAAVEVQAETPATAQQAVRERSQTVLDFLRASKVDRLQAGTMALYPVYGERDEPAVRRSEGATEIVGYRVQWSATFEIEAERAGEIVDGIVKAGAARISSFEFHASDEALAQAQQQALREAALRARENAHALLDALGYKPGEVVKIDVQSSGPIQPFIRRAESMAPFGADQGSSSTAVEPGLIEVNGSVSIEVGY